MRIIVTGHAGALGRALVSLALQKGHEVTGCSRSRGLQRTGVAEHVVDVVEADWARVVDTHDLVFHAAAAVHQHGGGNDSGQFYATNYEATSKLAKACRELGVPLVFVSTVAVLARPGPDERVSDTTAVVAPEGDYARSKWLAEEAIREQGRQGLEFTILRFPLLYGPGDRGNMARLMRAVARGRYWPVRSGVSKSCLHYADAARALWFASEFARSTRESFIVAPGTAPTLVELQRAVYASLHRRMPPPVPAAVLAGFGRALDRAAAAVGRDTTFSSSIRTLVRPAGFDGSRFKRVTGFSPEVTLELGLKEAAQVMFR